MTRRCGRAARGAPCVGLVPHEPLGAIGSRTMANGARAKTDAVDAQVLARMGAALALEPDAPVSPKLHEIKDLQVARTGLVTERTRLRNRSKTQINRVLKRQTKTRLALVERQIRELDTEIAKCIAEDAPMARKREILRSIPGLGHVAAAAILTSALRVRSGRSGLTACPRHPVRAALIRARHDGAKTGRQPRRSGPACARIRAMERQVVHQRGPKALARCPLHARSRGDAVQPRPQSPIQNGLNDFRVLRAGESCV